jgi:sucrose phosphatase-like protein
VKEDSLLVSDVDGTMLGDDRALSRFVEWYDAHRETMRLAYASGRFYESVVESIEATGLAEPDAVIGGVGTDICFYPSGEVVEAWHARINRNWDARRVRERLSCRGRLVLQPEEFQSPFKVSYYLDDATGEELLGIEEDLRAGSLDVQIVYSSKRDFDVLPRDADKGKAAAFLASLWGIPSERVMVSGDTGNDRALFGQGFQGIVVANALPELKKLRGPQVYHARHSFAAGVLEGVLHWRRRM